jgi:hypothetical protein
MVIQKIEHENHLLQKEKEYKFQYKRAITFHYYFEQVICTITHLKECLYRIEMSVKTKKGIQHTCFNIIETRCRHPFPVMNDFIINSADEIAHIIGVDQLSDNVYFVNN